MTRFVSPIMPRGMARLARVVVPGLPHRVTQRGSRRQQTFLSDQEDQAYKDLVATHRGRAGVAVWACRLVPDHVHLILAPAAGDRLLMGLGEANRRYSRRINFREGRRGHLRQGRIASFP